MPEIHCSCGHLFAVKPQFAGLPVACPRCNATHQVMRDTGAAPLAAQVVEEPLVVQPMSQPVGYAPAGVRKPPANNNAKVAIILLCVGVGAVMMVGLVFAVGVFFVLRASPEPSETYIIDSTVAQEVEQAVDSSEPIPAVPAGRQPLTEFRRKMIYRSARVRIRGPQDMLNRMRERNRNSNMPNDIRQRQERSIQNLVDSARRSVCTQYQITPEELDAILSDGDSRRW